MQKRFPLLRFRRLNTNLTRNDYDSVRECVYKGQLFPVSTNIGTMRYNLSVVDCPVALAKLFDYDEYKYSQLQMVLTPVHYANGAQKLYIHENSTPYMYYVKRIHPDDDQTVTDLQYWKNTPGVQKFSLMGRKPIVINFAIAAPRESEIIANNAGQAFTIQQSMRRVGWIHNPQETGPALGANYPNFGVIDFRIPQLLDTTGFLPKWRVEYYVTTYFKGNRRFQIEV